MAYLAIRGSGKVSGVSRLHGAVSRKLFQALFPRWPTDEVPVGHVTNGVHTPSWDGAEADALWTAGCTKDRWLGTLELLPGQVRAISDADLWACRTAARKGLIGYARDRLSQQLAVSGFCRREVETARRMFGDDILTLGFARRFAAYKRPNLLLQDPDRLLRLLTDARRPVQLILAGKAHPADAAGQRLVEDWLRFILRPEARSHVIFLSDYDMRMTEHLVQGVDVWINTPQRPWEACGTSGMKVLVNGGLNLSELDGWWAEAYTPAVGWAIGDGQDHGGDPVWDRIEATQLFEILERQVIPEFYSRDAHGIPCAWVGRVRESMASLTPTYSANRSVRQYVEECYVPAAARYRTRACDGGDLGRGITEWQRQLRRAWSTLRFGRLGITPSAGDFEITIEVSLGLLDPAAVSVELYAEARSPAGALRKVMQRALGDTDCDGRAVYSASVPADRPSSDYTVRVVPVHAGVEVPLENELVCWQR